MSFIYLCEKPGFAQKRGCLCGALLDTDINSTSKKYILMLSDKGLAKDS